ncbi:hypothetical protein Tco_0551134, partial [Tanacetum coccineum]
QDYSIDAALNALNANAPAGLNTPSELIGKDEKNHEINYKRPQWSRVFCKPGISGSEDGHSKVKKSSYRNARVAVNCCRVISAAGDTKFLHFNDSHKLAPSSSFNTIEVDEATTEINKGYNYTTSLGEVDEATTEIKKGYNYTTSLGATQKLCRFQFTFGQIINILQVKNPGLYAFKTNNTVSQRSNYKLQLFWLSQNMDKKGAELSVLRSRSALNICTGSARTSDNSVWIATKRGCLADLTAF